MSEWSELVRRNGIAVALVVCPRTGRWLMEKRSKDVSYGRTWGLPGGAVEDGEAPASAAARELSEEMGIHDARYVSQVSIPDEARAVCAVFVVKNEVKPKLTEESDAAEWVSEFPTPLIPVMKKHLNLYRNLIQDALKVIKEAPRSPLRDFSPGFKAWFGKSKVVNAQGKPLRMYHGSVFDIREFKREFLGKGHDQEGPGFYFTSDADNAGNYAYEKPHIPGQEAGPNLMPVYLRITNPVQAKPLTKQQIRELIKSGDPDSLNNFGDVEWEGRAKVVEEAVQAYTDVNSDTRRLLFSIGNDFYSGEDGKFLEALTRATGYDGIIIHHEQHTHAVAFHASQIKSVFNRNPTEAVEVDAAAEPQENLAEYPGLMELARHTPLGRPRHIKLGTRDVALSVGDRFLQLRWLCHGNYTLDAIVTVSFTRNFDGAVSLIRVYFDGHGYRDDTSEPPNINGYELPPHEFNHAPKPGQSRKDAIAEALSLLVRKVENLAHTGKATAAAEPELVTNGAPEFANFLYDQGQDAEIVLPGRTADGQFLDMHIYDMHEGGERVGCEVVFRNPNGVGFAASVELAAHATRSGDRFIWSLTLHAQHGRGSCYHSAGRDIVISNPSRYDVRGIQDNHKAVLGAMAKLAQNVRNAVEAKPEVRAAAEHESEDSVFKAARSIGTIRSGNAFVNLDGDASVVGIDVEDNGYKYRLQAHILYQYRIEDNKAWLQINTIGIQSIGVDLIGYQYRRQVSLDPVNTASPRHYKEDGRSAEMSPNKVEVAKNIARAAIDSMHHELSRLGIKITGKQIHDPDSVLLPKFSGDWLMLALHEVGHNKIPANGCQVRFNTAHHDYNDVLNVNVSISRADNTQVSVLIEDNARTNKLVLYRNNHRINYSFTKTSKLRDLVEFMTGEFLVETDKPRQSPRVRYVQSAAEPAPAENVAKQLADRFAHKRKSYIGVHGFKYDFDYEVGVPGQMHPTTLLVYGHRDVQWNGVAARITIAGNMSVRSRVLVLDEIYVETNSPRNLLWMSLASTSTTTRLSVSAVTGVHKLAVALAEKLEHMLQSTLLSNQASLHENEFTWIRNEQVATAAEAPRVGIRKHAIHIPEDHVVVFPTPYVEVKTMPAYKPAKAGNKQAAVDLLMALRSQQTDDTIARLFPGCTFVAPHAEEATGRNAIPMLLAAMCSVVAEGRVDTTIVQANRTGHTGSVREHRFATRAEFSGLVRPGTSYVLVDDNITSGATLADLGSFITEHGGHVAGLVALTSSTNYVRFKPDPEKLNKLAKRFGKVKLDELLHEHGLTSDSLTYPEFEFLSRYADADAVRNRIAKTGQEAASRLRARSIQAPEADKGKSGVAESASEPERAEDSSGVSELEALAKLKQLLARPRHVTVSGVPVSAGFQYGEVVIYVGENKHKFVLCPLHFGPDSVVALELDTGYQSHLTVTDSRGLDWTTPERMLRGAIAEAVRALHTKRAGNHVITKADLGLSANTNRELFAGASAEPHVNNNVFRDRLIQALYSKAMDDKFVVTKHVVDGETVYVRLQQRYQTELEVHVSQRNLGNTRQQIQFEETTSTGIRRFSVREDGSVVAHRDSLATDKTFHLPHARDVETYTKNLIRTCAEEFVQSGKDFKAALDRARANIAARKSATGSAEPAESTSVGEAAYDYLIAYTDKHNSTMIREVDYHRRKYFIRFHAVAGRIRIRVALTPLNVDPWYTETEGMQFFAERNGSLTWHDNGPKHVQLPMRGTAATYLNTLVQVCVATYAKCESAESAHLAEELKDFG